jgi:hypothetical protein
MPRKSKQEIEQEAAVAALLARPFAVDSTDPYGARDAAGKLAVAESIAQAKLAGASGNEMRAEFGERLTGPARRKVLREHGFDGPGYVAPSYVAYRDGEDRQGTRHAREHGALAEARRTEQREAEAEAVREAVAALSASALRKALAEHGVAPATGRGSGEANRAALAAAILG